MSISEDLFDGEGKLKYMKAMGWNDALFNVEKIANKDDDLPF